MSSQKKSALPNGRSDPRTLQQKAADTRKANKAAQERKAREIQDSIETPHPTRRAKEAAAQALQPSIGRKRRKEDSEVDSVNGKPAKAQRTTGNKQPEKRKGGTYDRKKYLAPVMEGSDEESDTTAVAKVSKSTQGLPRNAIEGDGKSESSKGTKSVLDARKGRKYGGGRATSDSSDQEDMDCRESRDELSSPSHHSYMEDVDNGEKLDSDEDDDLKGKDAAAIQGIFNQEHPLWSSPKGPPAKFNDDIILEATDEVAPDKTRQSRHRTHDLVSDSGPDEPSMTSKQKKRVTKSRRQEARDFEKPQWEEPGAEATKLPRKSRVKDEPVDEEHIPSLETSKKWPLEASIVHSLSGDLKLTDQPTPLRAVIRRAIKIQMKYILFTNAFPSMANRTMLTKDWLCAAALEEDSTINQIIRKRAMEDNQFVRALQDLVFARIPTIWLTLKESSVNAVAANYGLDSKDPEMVRVRVSKLLENDQYVFPISGVGTTVDPDADKPFQNPAIISVLWDVFFQKASSAGIVNMSSFVSAHKTRLEPELPDSMVALVGAAVYCALCEWKTGIRMGLSFTHAAFKPIYDAHTKTLENYRLSKPNKCHRGMVELYEAVTINCVRPSRPSSNSALALLNLDDDDEE